MHFACITREESNAANGSITKYCAFDLQIIPRSLAMHLLRRAGIRDVYRVYRYIRSFFVIFLTWYRKVSILSKARRGIGATD